jgi:septal ring factor EnvC (AmiA/AmiB activator)
MAVDKQKLHTVNTEAKRLKNENRALQRQLRQFEATQTELKAELSTNQSALRKAAEDLGAERKLFEQAKST